MYPECTSSLRLACLAIFLLVPSLATSETASWKPVLVVTDKSNTVNPLSNYLPEIMRAEGLVAFDQVDRSAAKSMPVVASRLAAYQTVILAEMKLDDAEAELLRQYVRGGGMLIAMRPDARLDDLFGVRMGEPRKEELLQYFVVVEDPPKDSRLPAGLGIVAEFLQYHGQAINYTLAGARPLAFLSEHGRQPSTSPAVTIHNFGKGHAVAFAFDLARSVVLMRQGNPQWKDSEGDGIIQYRPMDMFHRKDGRKYIDLNRLTIPQADETQRMFANIILSLSDKPLPRMWYLPKTHKTLMVNTGDAESLHETQIDPVLDECAKHGGFYSVYLRNGTTSPGIEKTTSQKEAAWRKAGHEVGVHVWAGGAEGKGAVEALDKAYEKIVGDLKKKFGHVSRTARNHTIDWTGWADMAAIEAKHGTGMDTNYYHYFSTENNRKTNGYFNGTGLPQRFSDAQGRILPIYQATTQWPDEWFADKKLTVAQTVAIMKSMFEAAQNGYYSAFVNNIHPPRFNNGDSITPKWPGEIWKYCKEKGIPSWSAEMLLNFLEARDAARFENLDWQIDTNQEKSRLTFDFHTPKPGQDLTVMIPSDWSGRKLDSLSVDGKPVEFKSAKIKGIGYVMFNTNQPHAKIEADYKKP
ncbi:MAG: hypothetical protein JXM70_22245 [Pirellulales bacterium]|nr:hypothetical protein [Pirellulales bacterium]